MYISTAPGKSTGIDMASDERLQAHSILGISTIPQPKWMFLMGEFLFSKFLQITRPKKQRLLVS